MSSAMLPAVTSPIAPDLRRYLDRLRDILAAKGTNKLLTVNDLVTAGLVTAGSDGSMTPTSPSTLGTPGAPAGLTATAALRSILLEWDSPTYAGHAFTEVWGHTADVIGDAVLLGLAPGVLYTDSVGAGVHRYYWVRFVNQDGAAGPFNAVAGTDATTSPELSVLMDALAEEYGTGSAAPFFQIDTPTTIGGVLIPAGTYMKAAFIHDATISNAKIADLAVDDAKIADLSVGKLTAGSLQVGSYIQSTSYTPGSAGWRVDADGTAEFSDVVVRGEVYATDGRFTGEVISLGSGGAYARMWSGNFEVYRDVPSVGVVQYKSLSRIESGTAAPTGVAVTIPGYFTTAPKVSVSPSRLNTYDPAYPAQAQALTCRATNIVEVPMGSMIWQFTPVAELIIADASGTSTASSSSGSVTGNWASAAFTTPANTASVDVSVDVGSLRRTGALSVFSLGSPAYQMARRKVRCRVEYDSGGGTWVSAGSWVEVVPPISTASCPPTVPDSTATVVTGTFPSSGTWSFRVAFEADDASSSAGGWAAIPNPFAPAPGGALYYNYSTWYLWPLCTASIAYSAGATLLYDDGSSAADYVTSPAAGTVNRFAVTGYEYTLGGATVLASGYVNWLAVGD